MIGDQPVRPPDPADAASFSRYLRRSARHWQQVTGSGIRYESTLALLWFGFGPAIGTWLGLTSPVPAHPPLNWAAGAALLVAALALLTLGAAAVGPVTVPAAYRVWVLSTPLDRRILLRRPFFRAIAATTGLGAVLGALAADVTGLRDVDALTTIVLGAAAGAGAGAAAVLVQVMSTRLPSRELLGVGVIGLVAAVPLRLLTLPPPPSAALVLLAAAGVAAAVVYGMAAGRATGRLTLSRVPSNSAALAGFSLAAGDLSLAPLTALLSQPDRRRRRVLVGRDLSGTGQQALAAVVRRLALRNAEALGRWLLLAAGPYLLRPLFSGIGWSRPALAIVVLLCAVAAISGMTDTARQFASDPQLAQRYGLARAPSRRTAMQVPYAATALFAVVTAPVLIGVGPAWLALFVPLAAIGLVEFRASLAPFEPTFQMRGGYSWDLIRQFLRGPVLLVILALVLKVITNR